MLLASLPMYDLPEAAAATDSLWQGLARAFAREGLKDVPEYLTRANDYTSLWRAPDLLFSQSCGYPLTHGLKDNLRVVATPAYCAPGCDGVMYCSHILVRAEDPAEDLEAFKGRIAVCNARDSQSGYSALRAAVAPVSGAAPFFARVAVSGSHAKSLELVACGEADICATDCVTYALLARYRPEAVRGLRRLTQSLAAPGLPYVTRAGMDEENLTRLRAGLFRMLEDPSLEGPRAALFIEGAKVLPDTAYTRILEIEREAQDLGYPELI